MGVSRRTAFGLLGLGLPGLGAFGYAAQTGRINVLTPELPESGGDLPGVPGVRVAGRPVPGLTRAAFAEGVSLLNVWASWCPYCRSEHEHLLRLAGLPGIRLFGLATDDSADNVADYLDISGNPYSRLSIDTRRVYQRSLVHRGIPQTYVFAADGRFVDKISGELTSELITAKLVPAIGRASRPA